MTESTETLHTDLIISRENYDCSETLNTFSQYFSSLSVNYTYTCYIYVLRCFISVQLCVTLQTIAHQAPLSKRFSRQEYWCGLPCPPPGDLSRPGTEHVSLSLLYWQAGSLPLGPPGKPQLHRIRYKSIEKLSNVK